MFCTLPNDSKFPYLFDMNEAKQKHNESTFLWSEGDVFMLHAQDRHHDTCVESFQLQNDANFIAWLHLKVQIKKNMLVQMECSKDQPQYSINNKYMDII
jgi:hypothetical protein